MTSLTLVMREGDPEHERWQSQFARARASSSDVAGADRGRVASDTSSAMIR